MRVEKKIIIGCQKKENKQEETLYHLLKPCLLNICSNHTITKEDAEDLLQDVFIKIYEKIHQYNFKGSFEGWAKRVAKTHAIDQIRKKQKKQHIPFFSPHSKTLPEESLLNDELTCLLNHLPPEKKTIFTLIALKNYSHKETSQLFNISEKACSSIYHKAKITLQTHYKSYQLKKASPKN